MVNYCLMTHPITGQVYWLSFGTNLFLQISHRYGHLMGLGVGSGAAPWIKMSLTLPCSAFAKFSQDWLGLASFSVLTASMRLCIIDMLSTKSKHMFPAGWVTHWWFSQAAQATLPPELLLLQRPGKTWPYTNCVLGQLPDCQWVAPY